MAIIMQTQSWNPVGEPVEINFEWQGGNEMVEIEEIYRSKIANRNVRGICKFRSTSRVVVDGCASWNPRVEPVEINFEWQGGNVMVEIEGIYDMKE